ncbi:hypothetical protein PF008_g25050 [Phytophthora fragariae]|nr:hypothetical protein PF008_g25050 [Phytophthora fragariae]
MQQTVGASFVLRLVLGLAPEKRAVCQTLREIMNLDNTARLVLVPTTKGLKPISGKTNAADWTNVNQHKLKHPRHRGGRRPSMRQNASLRRSACSCSSKERHQDAQPSRANSNT